MQVQQIRTGGDRNFGYLLVRGGEALIVDPGEDTSGLEKALAASGARLRWLVGTHSHGDHIAGIDRLHRNTGISRVLGSKAGHAAEVSVGAEESDLALADIVLYLLPTPGHTPCSLCLYAPVPGGTPHLFSGDTLFVGKIGGTRTESEARQEYDSLHDLLDHLPAETVVWPGHDYGVRPSSTLGAERRENPFLLCASFQEFLWLKGNWTEYKRSHGIA